MAALDLEGSHSMTSIEAAMERIGRNWGWIFRHSASCSWSPAFLRC